MDQKNTVETINTVLRAFEKGDIETLLNHIDDQIDFRIDHYKDNTDISWQQAKDKQGLLGLLQRLGSDVFPQGTKIIDLYTTDLGDNWALTKFHQEFYYGVEHRTVTSLTWILSHSAAGKCDYFRESVTGLKDK